jgi:hypothetical protein
MIAQAQADGHRDRVTVRLGVTGTMSIMIVVTCGDSELENCLGSSTTRYSGSLAASGRLWQPLAGCKCRARGLVVNQIRFVLKLTGSHASDSSASGNEINFILKLRGKGKLQVPIQISTCMKLNF